MLLIASNYGGAIAFETSNAEVFIMPGTVFDSNSVPFRQTSPDLTCVSGTGGAIYLGTFQSNFYIYSTTFQNNLGMFQ